MELVVSLVSTLDEEERIQFEPITAPVSTNSWCTAEPGQRCLSLYTDSGYETIHHRWNRKIPTLRAAEATSNSLDNISSAGVHSAIIRLFAKHTANLPSCTFLFSTFTLFTISNRINYDRPAAALGGFLVCEHKHSGKAMQGTWRL